MQLPNDPLERFTQIYRALNADRGWFSDASPLRFAAMAALMCPGSPDSVAQSIRDVAEELRKRAGWFGELNGSLRFIVAAMLVQNGDSANAFMDESERVRKLFREAKIRRGGSYEVIAVLILRGNAKTEPELGTVRRLQAIHEEMSKHQWWLTDVGDIPACAILTARPQSPAEIAQEAEDIYQALVQEGFKKGNPLQAAANLLCLANQGPDHIAARFRSLAEAFGQQGTAIWKNEYDELAILSFLQQPASHVVDEVLYAQERISQLSPKPGRSLAFNLASSIAFTKLAQAECQVDSVTDAKAMIDMQAIINAQQAAIAAATAASVAASTAAASS